MDVGIADGVWIFEGSFTSSLVSLCNFVTDLGLNRSKKLLHKSACLGVVFEI